MSGSIVAKASAQTSSSVTQFGITWTFDSAYEVGRSANGDFWVVGPVAVIEITPGSTSVNGRMTNGSMANPLPSGGSRQGYDSAISGTDGSIFDEDGGTYRSGVDGRVLYGQSSACSGESSYWRNLAFDTGSRTCPDPYEYIDGGHRPGQSYQYCCLSQPWKGEALAVLLIPQVRALWKNHSFFQYADRWVEEGTLSQPDPCAPLPVNLNEDNWSSLYGMTFGPDGRGGCIKDNDPSNGTGRFPQLHGSNVDGGHYGSSFVNDMWNAYRSTVQDPGSDSPRPPQGLHLEWIR